VAVLRISLLSQSLFTAWRQQIRSNKERNEIMVSTKEIILEYVFPALGVIMGNCMFFAPYGDLKQAIRDGNLGDLNPTPWAFMLGNCFGWVLYGMLLQNFWIFAGNAPGFILSVWLNLGAVKLLHQGHCSSDLRKSLVTYLQEHESTTALSSIQDRNGDAEPPKEKSADAAIKKQSTTATDWASIVWNVTLQNTPAPTPHEHLILGMVVIWMCCVSVIAFANALSQETKQFIVGLLVNVILVFFYGAPLSTILKILRDRNTASLHIPTMILNTLNGIFWMVYGIAVNDYFIYAPNGLGAGMGGIQIVLSFIFPKITSNSGSSSNNVSMSGDKTNTKEETDVQQPRGKGRSDNDSIHSA
jgi:solute carrier family 50 protein (sugar transporter)